MLLPQMVSTCLVLDLLLLIDFFRYFYGFSYFLSFLGLYIDTKLRKRETRKDKVQAR